jgi:hypothetical protein
MKEKDSKPELTLLDGGAEPKNRRPAFADGDRIVPAGRVAGELELGRYRLLSVVGEEAPEFMKPEFYTMDDDGNNRHISDLGIVELLDWLSNLNEAIAAKHASMPGIYGSHGTYNLLQGWVNQRKAIIAILKRKGVEVA